MATDPTTISDKDIDALITGGKPLPVGGRPNSKPETSGLSDSAIDALIMGKKASSGARPPWQWQNKVGGGAPLSKPSGGILDTLGGLYKGYDQFNRDIGTGATQGLRDVAASFDPIAQYLEKHVGSVTLGGLLPTADQAHANNVSARNAFDASNPGMVQSGGRLAGQAIGAGPLIEALGVPGMTAAAPAGMNILLKTLLRGAQGGILGGEGALATSGASDQPLGEQFAGGAELGATLGAGVPLAIMGGAAGARRLGQAASLLTSSGRSNAAERMAKGLIDEFGGGPVNTGGLHEIVPGSKPTLAEVSHNPGVAGLQKALQDLNQNSPLLARTDQNNQARSALFDLVRGTPDEKDRALNAINAQTRIVVDKLFPKTGGQAADVTPVKQAIEGVLSGPSGNRPDIQAAMADVLKTMERDGKTIPDPKTLYKSVRDNINHLISGKDLNKTYGKQAARELLEVRDALDTSIDSAAPGFKQYLQDYAAARAPVTSMEFLQKQHITDAQGNITLAGVQRAIRSLDAEVRASGVKPGKAVSTAQRDALEAIRDDLLRRDKADKRALHIGSPTVKNTINQQRLGLAAHVGPGTLATLGGTMGEVFGATHGAPGLGAFAGGTLGALIGKSLPDVNALMRTQIERNLERMVLDPSSYAAVSGANPTSGGAANLLNSGALNRLVAPSVMAKNRLMQNR